MKDDLYAELKRLAAARMRSERAGHTLSPTALVHEAYMRLAKQKPPESRGQMLAAAALMMRRILVSHARGKSMQKRGSGARAVTFDEAAHGGEVALAEIVALDDLLARLEDANARHARVVSYRIFGGMTDIEIAEVLGVSAPTVRRDWRVARAWIAKELGR